MKIISKSGISRPESVDTQDECVKWYKLYQWPTVCRSLMKSKSKFLRVILAESLGTFVLVFVGIGGGLQCSKYSKEKSCSSVHGPLAGGLGAALGIYIGANASGGHANPAVTIAFAVLGRLGHGFRQNFILFWIYFISQVIGGLIAAAFGTVNISRTIGFPSKIAFLEKYSKVLFELAKFIS